MGGVQVLPDEATARAGISAPPERRREFLWTLRAGGGAGRLALGVLSELMQPGGLPAEGALGAILRYALLDKLTVTLLQLCVSGVCECRCRCGVVG